MPENLSLFFDDVYAAMRGFVSAAGGSKVIGPLIFPTKGDKAAGWLDDCLNRDRNAKLDPEEMLLLLKLARERNFHGVMGYILTETRYAPPEPIEPEDEVTKLLREYLASKRSNDARDARLERAVERLLSERPGLRSVG